MNLQEQINRIQSMMGVITEIFDDGEETELPIYIRRRFSFDELNDLVKNVKDQIEEGESLDTAIYDTIRHFIVTKNFKDIDNNAPEREYWDSYLRYEEPLVKYVKKKLGYE
jgi:hypothetical protein